MDKTVSNCPWDFQHQIVFKYIRPTRDYSSTLDKVGGLDKIKGDLDGLAVDLRCGYLILIIYLDQIQVG